MRTRLETERLTLRPFEAADAPRLAHCLRVPAIARMTAGIPHPYPLVVAEGWIEIARAHMRRGLRFSWAVEAKNDGLVGGMGVFRRAAGAPWEMGYWIAQDHWGRGFASEAASVTVSWARDELGADRLIAGHYVDNAASRRVLEKLGFTTSGPAEAMYCLARNTHVDSVPMALRLAPAAIDAERACA